MRLSTGVETKHVGVEAAVELGHSARVRWWSPRPCVGYRIRTLTLKLSKPRVRFSSEWLVLIVLLCVGCAPVEPNPYHLEVDGGADAAAWVALSGAQDAGVCNGDDDCDGEVQKAPLEEDSASAHPHDVGAGAFCADCDGEIDEGEPDAAAAEPLDAGVCNDCDDEACDNDCDGDERACDALGRVAEDRCPGIMPAGECPFLDCQPEDLGACMLAIHRGCDVHPADRHECRCSP